MSQYAFDVGHSSIGWAVLQSPLNAQPSALNLLGCGVVTFGADDCLASKRRDYRRQRRHIRATRQRIRRLKALLAHLGVLTPAQIDRPGCAWPWLLAARVLRGGPLMSWPELWDVLRWYAHNRGYDGNHGWSGQDPADAEDAEKVQNARALYQKHGTHSMAETFCAVSGLDPLGDKKSCNLRGEQRPKGLNAAFPREDVEAEVRRILERHRGALPGVDDAFVRALFEDWRTIPCTALSLPDRFRGGLLFGQLVPRFDNRIVAECPVTFAEEYQRLLADGLSPQEARHKASDLAKVPGRHCLEFLEFRWAMNVANIRIGHGAETYQDRDGKVTSLRPLTADERRKVDARARRLGFLKVEPDKPNKDGLMREGKNELRQIVLEETKCDRHNLGRLLLDPNAKEGLVLLPVDGDTSAFRLAWSCFDDPAHDDEGRYHDSPLRHRFATQLLRQKKLCLQSIIQQLEKIEASTVAERIRESAREQASDRHRKLDEAKLAKLMTAEFFCPKLRGRARFSRVKMRQAFQEVFRRSCPLHPLETGGCLEQTQALKQAAAEKELAEQTNNHLVRHRLLILERLLHDIIAALEFAGGSKRRIARITVEVARDLQEMSGLDSTELKPLLAAKLANHQKVAAVLAEKLRKADGTFLRDSTGRPLAASPGMIRKARILEDLGRKCPYTGHDIEFIHLASPHPKFGTVDRDHVIPRTQRLSDALEAQVITFSEINRLKDKWTALQFIREMNKPANKHHKDRFGIKTEAQFRRDVDALWPAKDPFKRARAGGPKPTDDEARCWRRKKLLLTASWDGKDFTPADLAKTRHVVKLAAQQLAEAFYDLPKQQQPPVISITGAVTAAFRDKSWKLFGELAAVNPGVKAALAEGAKEWEAGRDFNPKKTVRETSHLHHALDAIALGLVTSLLVPQSHQSLDGDLSRWIVKAKLNAEERRQFEQRRHELGLRKFYRWAASRCDKPEDAAKGEGGLLCIDDLPPELKDQIRHRLAEKRVVQHVPADTSGLDCDETVYRVLDPNGVSPNARRLRKWFEELLCAGHVKKLKKLPDPHDPKESLVVLTARKRRNQPGGDKGKTLHDTDNEWRWIYLVVAKNSVHGLKPSGGQSGKLAALKGAKLLGENFGVAEILCADGQKKYEIIRPRKVWKQLEELRLTHARSRIRLIRKGTLVDLQGDDGEWRRMRSFGCGERPGRGIFFYVGAPDAIAREREIQVSTFANGRAKLVPVTLTGATACPTTSSA